MKLERPQLLRAAMISATAAVACAAISTAFVILDRTSVFDALDVQAWRPAFIVWSAGFMFAGWVLHQQGQKKQPTEAPENAKPKGTGRSTIAMLWIAAATLVLGLTFPALSSAVSTALEPKWPAIVSPNAVTTTIVIPSMDCDSCIRSIDGILRRQRGVEKARLNMQNGQAEIWYNPDKTQDTSIIDALKAHGYEIAAP